MFFLDTIETKLQFRQPIIKNGQGKKITIVICILNEKWIL